MPTKNKEYYINKLVYFFQKNTFDYFLSILKQVTNTSNLKVNYKQILLNLNDKELNNLYGLVKDNLEESPNGAAAGPISDKIRNPETGRMVSTTGKIGKALIQKLLKSSNLSPKQQSPRQSPKQQSPRQSPKQQSPRQQSPRQSPKNLIPKKGTKEYYNYQLIQLSRFNIGDIFNLSNNNYEIIQEIGVREDTLLYKGKNLNGETVLVKIQPRNLDYSKIDELIGNSTKKSQKKTEIPFQITTESHIFKLLNSKCKETPVSKYYDYGMIKNENIKSKIQKTQIEKYVLITEFLHNGDLKNIVYNNTKEIKSIFIEVIKALKLLHKCGYLHLDIKHENIMFSNESKDKIKLIDFGLTEAVFDRNGIRQKLDIKSPIEGSPLYMSIAQHKGQIRDYMDDLQAIAWTLLDLYNSDSLDTIGQNLSWSLKPNILELKEQFIQDYKNNFTNSEVYIKNPKLTKHNLFVIGELADYTHERSNKINKKTTDKLNRVENKKTMKTIVENYYSDYNDEYYDDIVAILNKLK
jgi:serine/threonine protein kinase